MALRLITAPTNEPLTNQETLDHLRIDYNDDDLLVYGLITAAREHVEKAELSSALISQTWELVLDNFPALPLAFPLPPLQSVTSIKYTDRDDVEATYSSANYIVDTATWPGRLVLKTDSSWPTVTLKEIGGVVIRFVAGYGDNPGDVPTPIRHAMKLMISDWYDNRENSPLISGINGVVKMPFAARQLLASYRQRQF